jgi:hypothetical protein
MFWALIGWKAKNFGDFLVRRLAFRLMILGASKSLADHVQQFPSHREHFYQLLTTFLPASL